QRLVCGLGLANGNVTQGHGGILSGASGGIQPVPAPACPQLCPHVPPDCKICPRTASDDLKRKTPHFCGVFVVLWTSLYVVLVPEIGIEPTTYALRMRRSTN